MSHKNVVKYCLLMYQCSIFGSGSANKVDRGGGQMGSTGTEYHLILTRIY